MKINKKVIKSTITVEQVNRFIYLGVIINKDIIHDENERIVKTGRLK